MLMLLITSLFSAVFTYVLFLYATGKSLEIDYSFEILLASAGVVSLLMLIPVYFVTHHLVKPLQKMNGVARSMGQGDFTIRADNSARGEIGELAHSFNDLADKLSNSISELTIERNRLREIFDVISEGIVSIDLELKPIYANPAISSLFENVKRKNFFTERLKLIPFEEVWTDFKKCMDTGTTIERTIDARENAYLVTMVPSFDSNRQVTGATGFFRDISESEHLEQTRRDYVANVSHELRTPLTALRGLVEPLADGMVRNEEDRMRYYGIILHETLRLSRLIDDMLELSRLQARTIAFKTFPFDLNVLLSELKAKFTPIMNDATISFAIDCKGGPCPTVMGNPDRVEQILIILMDNAKKYTAAGGMITISTEFDEKQDVVLVSVKDTGQGIHEYDIDHIFDRFYKADRARGKKGTGLGLSIAKELLNYMGETITVQSDYGEGTTFTFTLKRVHGTQWY
jgi:signal transduction histidine kinase